MSEQLIGPRPIWQGRSWRLLVERVALPDGSAVERGMVDHPGSVVLIPLLGEQVVLIRQYRRTLDQIILELPAGTRHPGEPPELCAQRELREETGLRAAQLTPLGTIYPSPGLTNEAMHLFLATGLTADPLPMDADEQIETQLLPLEEAVRMARSGAIADAKTIVGLLWAEAARSAGDGAR